MGIPVVAYCDDSENSSEDNPEAGVGAQEAGGARPPEEKKRNLEGEEGPSSSKKRRVEEQPASPTDSSFPSLSSIEELPSIDRRETSQPAMSQQGGIPGETEPGGNAPQPPSVAPLEIPASSVTQDAESERNTILERTSEILRAHEAIGKLILNLRGQEGMRIPGGFQAECLAEMLEAEYGGEQMPGIEQDIRQNGINSRFYNETKTYFNYLKHAGVTEASLRKEWQGKKE